MRITKQIKVSIELSDDEVAEALAAYINEHTEYNPDECENVDMSASNGGSLRGASVTFNTSEEV